MLKIVSGISTLLTRSLNDLLSKRSRTPGDLTERAKELINLPRRPNYSTPWQHIRWTFSKALSFSNNLRISFPIKPLDPNKVIFMKYIYLNANLKKDSMNNTKIKTYFFALIGLMLFSSGLCLLGESIIYKIENKEWFIYGTTSLILINLGLGLMIKNIWGSF